MAEVPRKRTVYYGSRLPATTYRSAGTGRRKVVIDNPAYLDPYPTGSRGATKRAYENELLRQGVRDKEIEQIANQDLIRSIAQGKPVGVWAPQVRKVEVSDKLRKARPETVAMMGVAASPQVLRQISGVPEEERYGLPPMANLESIARAKGLMEESPIEVARAEAEIPYQVGAKVPEHIKESRQIFLGLARAYGADENDEVMAAIGTMTENPASRAIIQKFFGSKTMDPATREIYETHIERLNQYYGKKKSKLDTTTDLTTTDVQKLQEVYNKLRAEGNDPETAKQKAYQQLGL